MQAQDRSPRVIGYTELKEKYLPHRYPLVLLDRVTDFSPGEFIEAIKCVTGNAPDMVGHFPERCIMPGTSVIQACAQLAIVFFKLSTRDLHDDELTLISSVNFKFLAPIPPGELLKLRMTTKNLTKEVGIFDSEATITNGKSVARGTLSLARASLSQFSEVPW
jgi:3-hydroxyacyl-[acyl-carrier-protein] dehydratase